MKRILLSLLTVAAVSAVAIGATRAFFSDTETSKDNKISAGKLDLSVNGQNPLVGPLITLKDLKPSFTHYSSPITLNVLDNPAKLYKHIVGPISCITVDVTEPECTVQGGTWNGQLQSCDLAPTADDNDLTKVTWFDLEIWRGPGEPTPESLPCGPEGGQNCWGVLIPDKRIKLSDIASHWIYLGTFNPNQAPIIRQSFHMDDSAGNAYQSDSCTFDEEFMALQTNAPDPENVFP